MNEAQKRYLIKDIHLCFLALGIYQLMPGTELPLIRADYGISYQLGGLLLSMQSVGVLIGGLFAGVPAKYLGAKKTYILFECAAILGLLLTVMTGIPGVLMIAMICLGLAKGSGTYYGNQMASNLSGGDASLQNLIQAMFAAGACAAPFVAMVCGSSWRTAYLITAGVCAVSLLHSLRVNIGPEAYRAIGEAAGGLDGQAGKRTFGFLREKLFWFCAVLMFTYMAVEASVIGWLVTYLMDYGGASKGSAQIVVTALWAVLLVGRFICAAAAKRYAPWQMIAAMAVGMTIFFAILTGASSFPLLVISALGLGFFMSGMYGTCVAGTGSLMTDYPMCMGVMIALPGLGPIILPSVIGTIAEHSDIHRGFLFLWMILIIMLISTCFFVRYERIHVKDGQALK